MADLPRFFYGIVSLNWFVDNVVGILALLATVGAIFLAWRNLKKIQEQIELQKQESEQNAIARVEKQVEIVGK
jgi:arginine exporter protein ArgO